MSDKTLPIAATLAAASKSVGMNPDVAFETLITCLGAAGMSTSVAFTPVASAAAASSASSGVGAGVAVGGTAIVAGAAAVVIGTYAPSIESISYQEEMTNQNVPVRIQMNNTVGIDDIYATSQDGTRYYGERQNDGSYVISVADNGVYDVMVQSSNGKTVTDSFTITNVDKASPEVVDYSLSGDLLSLTYKDEMSEIDFNSAYAVDESGNEYRPSNVDTTTGLVEYNYPHVNLTAYISDALGNKATHTITKK